MTITAADLRAQLEQLPPDTPVAIDDGVEYRALASARPSKLEHIDDDDHVHDVPCLVLTLERDGASLDADLARVFLGAPPATPASGSTRAPLPAVEAAPPSGDPGPPAIVDGRGRRVVAPELTTFAPHVARIIERFVDGSGRVERADDERLLQSVFIAQLNAWRAAGQREELTHRAIGEAMKLLGVGRAKSQGKRFYVGFRELRRA